MDLVYMTRPGSNIGTTVGAVTRFQPLLTLAEPDSVTFLRAECMNDSSSFLKASRPRENP